MVGSARQKAEQTALRCRRMGPLRGTAPVIKHLPKNLLLLDHEELREARDDRDERMTLLFRRWPSLSQIELRELRKLSDERQRLARHVGNHGGLRALRAS